MKEKKISILDYIPLVRTIAYKMSRKMPPSIEEDDLVSSGMIGLINAANRFDPTKGTSFKTYAWGRIEGAMLDELRSLDWVPRLVRSRKTEPYSYKDIPPKDKLIDLDKLVEHKQIFDAVKSLSEKEKRVIFLYYYEDMTMKEAGEKLKISEARVCQIHKSAIADLVLVLAN